MKIVTNVVFLTNILLFMREQNRLNAKFVTKTLNLKSLLNRYLNSFMFLFFEYYMKLNFGK